MKINKLFTLAAVSCLAFSGTAVASPTKAYQVTGPVLEMNDSMIAVQKGKERWEIARDAATKGNGDVKVGDKVTIMYTMTATEISPKAAGKSKKAAKADASASASPAASSSPVASPAKK